jgi:hypothetical protein
MWPNMTGGQVIEVANFIVFTVLLMTGITVLCESESASVV